MMSMPYCPVCQSSHPNGFPKVCLVQEGLLEQHVLEEYPLEKRQGIDKLKTREQGTKSASTTQYYVIFFIPTLLLSSVNKLCVLIY